MPKYRFVPMLTCEVCGLLKEAKGMFRIRGYRCKRNQSPVFVCKVCQTKPQEELEPLLIDKIEEGKPKDE